MFDPSSLENTAIASPSLSSTPVEVRSNPSSVQTDAKEAARNFFSRNVGQPVVFYISADVALYSEKTTKQEGSNIVKFDAVVRETSYAVSGAGIDANQSLRELCADDVLRVLNSVASETTCTHSGPNIRHDANGKSVVVTYAPRPQAVAASKA